MKHLNSVILEGNCVRDPQVTITSHGKTLCTFSIANSRYYKSNENFVEDVSFIDVQTWGKWAEIVSEKCKKGRGVRIVGRLKQLRWHDSNNKTRSKIIVLAEHIDFKPETHKPEQGAQNTSFYTPKSEMPPMQSETNYDADFDDDLPEEELVF